MQAASSVGTAVMGFMSSRGLSGGFGSPDGGGGGGGSGGSGGSGSGGSNGRLLPPGPSVLSLLPQLGNLSSLVLEHVGMLTLGE